MTKPPITHPDPLVMKVRKALRDVEPRTYPTESKRNPYGFDCWVCPYCEELVHKRGRNKLGGFNMHFAAIHATPFWRELHLIKVLKREGE